MKAQGNNVYIPMTTRSHDLRKKALVRDSAISKKIIRAWDKEGDAEKVFSIFMQEKDRFSSQRYWETLRSVWIICGSTDKEEQFKPLFNSKKKNKYCFSTPEEAELLRGKENSFLVYRACNEGNERGFSWTYDVKYAESYKESYNKDKVIWMVVSKKDVFALINRNNEHEILIIK